MATDTSTSDAEASTGGEDFVPFFGQFFPESLTLAVLLALLALVVTIPVLSTVAQLEAFATGYFGLFTVQMALILLWVLSAAVVESEPVGRVFDWIAAQLPADSQSKVIYATGFIALLFGWINWALGLIGGILVGRALAQRAEENGVSVHYPLVLTAGLLSMVITTVGLSSPGALMMADASGTTNFLVNPDQGTLVIEMASFLLHPVVVIASAVLLVTLPALLVALAPDAGEHTPVSEFEPILEGSIRERLAHYAPPPREEWVFADLLEQSRLISGVTFLLGGISLVAYFVGGGGLTLLWLLFGLMMLGIFLQLRPMAYVAKTRSATKWANHLAIPFLLYGGVYALLSEAGLYGTVGDLLAGTGITQVTAYLTGLVVGVLVPSAGSVWLVVSPAFVSAQADLVPALVSVMFGAGVSNVWLGFLFAGVFGSIYGFDWREYLRYAAAVTVYVSVLVVALLVVF